MGKDRLTPARPFLDEIRHGDRPDHLAGGGVQPDKIGLIIGPGGKTIKGIVAETGAEINIEDDGSINIYSNNGDAMARAKEIILGMTKELEVGETYHARVVSTKEFGAFVELKKGTDGLLHVSDRKSVV